MKTEPNVTISETNPGEEPLPDLTAPLTAKTVVSFQCKRSRNVAIEMVTAARDIPRGIKLQILDEIAVLPPQFDLVMITVFRHPHKNGGNFGATVVEI